jgi:large subunit ribosomal protein L21
LRFRYLQVAETIHINRLNKKPRRAARAAGYEHEGKMFAVIKTGGKQYRVGAEDKLQVAKVAG